ncbi:hypothetical protein GCM10010319_14840 [Streptomyces blastmyceticus]|uniref:Uncharacterized protein n=1 Tax=Streptomyces blastmyceticus TaxID=68180 RepID=A0ABN0WJS2_9ACTN
MIQGAVLRQLRGREVIEVPLDAPPAAASRGGQASALDGLCDLLGRLGGREVRGVDDLSLGM